MRIGSFTMYDNFQYGQQQNMKSLNEINSQMSGLKIQYGFQDIDVSVNTLRLDKEENALAQTSQAAKGGLEFSQNSDKALNDISTALSSFKTKLVNAASDTNGTVNRDAIAKELTDLKNYMINIANTSINGRYLFSGSAMGVKPISNDGIYHGNDQQVKALVDSNVQYAFNVDGQSLWLGQDLDYQKTITTNVPMKNKTLLNSFPSEDRYVTVDDKVRDMTGNNGDGQFSYFYVSGKTSEGSSFKHIIQENIDSPISDLLSKIKNEFSGNVDVSLNQQGQIEIKDLKPGSSQIEFNIVGYDNTTPLTKATAGLTIGSSSITVQDATGISAGSVLNIDGIGQVTVDASYTSGTTIPLTLPLQASKEQLAGDVNVRKVLYTNTTTASASVAGATSISLSSIALSSPQTGNLEAGDNIVIGNSTYKVASITSASAPYTVNLTQPLSSAIASGDNITLRSLPSSIGGNSSILSSGARVTEFTKSGSSQREIGNITGTNDYWDHRQFNFNTELRLKQNGTIASSGDLLANVFGSAPDTTSFGITLNGVVPPATTPSSTSVTFSFNSASTVGDYLTQIQNALDGKFGQNKFQATMDDYGRISVKDLTISENDRMLSSSNLVGITLTAPNNTFANMNGVETDRTYFEKSGSKLTSNVSQIIKPTASQKNNEFATEKTKLSEVSGLSSMSQQDGILSVVGSNITVGDISKYKTNDRISIGSSEYTITSITPSTNTLTLSAAPVATATSLNRSTNYTMSLNDKNGSPQTVNLNLGLNHSTFEYGISSATASSAIGTNTVTVGSGSGYSAGDKVVIGGNEYSVASVAGNVLTLGSNITSTAVATGDKIYKRYEILDASNPQGYTSGDNVTYKQLMDVMSMISSATLPSTTAIYPATVSSTNMTDYNNATVGAQKTVQVKFNQNAQITLEDMTSTGTNTSLMFSFYDNVTNSDFSTTKSINTGLDKSLSLNSNTMLSIDNPHIDFFGQLQDAIDSVKSGKLRADYANPFGERNTGIENAITMIDHVTQHTIKKHTEVGAISNAFTSANDRAEALKLNVIGVRSSFIDTDLAEASANLNQRMLGYQAMMSVISKITGLSLVNYLK